MKKISLALVVLLPLLFACQPVNDDTDFKDPAFLQYCGRLTTKSVLPGTKASTSAPVGTITSIELTESGFYAMGTVVDEAGTVTYRTGRYGVEGNVYTLYGVGTLHFNNSASGSVSLIFTPMYGEPQQLPADFLRPKSTNKAFRTWNVEKTRITVKGFTVVSADFNGCNLAEIAEFLRNNGNKAPEDVPNLSVCNISLTGTDTMIVGYNDNSALLNEFSLNGNVLTYTWEERPMGFTFITEEAVITYQDGKCLLSIDGWIENSTTSGSVTFVLSPTD